MRIDGRMCDFVGDEAGFGEVVGVGKTFFRISEDVVIVLFEVVGLVVVDEVALGLHRFFGIEIGGQELVFNVDQLERLIRRGLVDRGDTSDVIANVADFIERERVLVMADGQNAIGIGRVFSYYDGDDAFQFFGAAGVHALDAGVRIRRMQDSPDEHSGQREVVGIFAGPGGLAGGVDHGGRFADDGEVVGRWSLVVGHYRFLAVLGMTRLV